MTPIHLSGVSWQRALWPLRHSALRAWLRVGPAGLFSVAALVLALLAVLWRMALPPLPVNLPKAPHRVVLAPVDTSAADPRIALATFERQLGGNDTAPLVIDDLLARASKMNLQIQHGQYQPQADQQGGFVRYRMIFPLLGDAAAVNRFVFESLRAHPALALEALHIKRQKADTPTVDATVQFLLLRRLPNAAPELAPEVRHEG